jgi:hypothetical protein
MLAGACERIIYVRLLSIGQERTLIGEPMHSVCKSEMDEIAPTAESFVYYGGMSRCTDLNFAFDRSDCVMQQQSV